jgi:hypothetical protein
MAEGVTPPVDCERHHTGLFVQDVREAVEFYLAVFTQGSQT